jgi:hypothetical protein
VNRLNRLSNTAITQIDESWAAVTGCTLAELRGGGTAIVELPAAEGAEYVQLFRRGANLAAMAVARALGFVNYGATIYLAATAT